MAGQDTKDAGAQSRERFVGREAELEALAALFDPDGPEVVALSGIPGVGKSALLRALARRGAEQGVDVHILDCRVVEPTAGAFTRAVPEEDRTAEVRPRVLCLDHYDHFLLLDTWLRQQFAASLGERTRLLLAGRSPVGMGWASSGLRYRSLKLDGLEDQAARALLAQAGLPDDHAERALAFTRGHPLALVLALSVGPDRTWPAGGASAPPEVVQHLTRFFLEHVDEPQTREALEAASAVRRVTRPILTALLGEGAPESAYDTLAALPLVEVRQDGLALHPTVHGVIASWLRTADPARFTTYRRRAWRALEDQGRSIGARDLWRYTADVIYLIDDPIVREAFFPSGDPGYAVEPARPDDHATIAEISALHDGPEECARIEAWLEAAPGGFHVVRDRGGVIQGFYLMLDPASVPRAGLEADPVTAAWRVDLPGALREGHRRTLFLRRWLSRAWGDAPSPLQAACWVDVKRAYLENRPLLRRVYLAVSELAPYAEAAGKLGFVPVCAEGGLPFASAMLDFGPGSVDAWLGRLVRQDLGLDDEVRVDPDRRGLVLSGAFVALTPRELDVSRILRASAGSVVSREELLQRVWEGGYSVGSNVVDVLIRALRKKLGARADLIETVRGAGYRWRA